ncbi:hypothetical protein VTO42DRAFT_1458 [Malbranchea cinnamomea]
MSSLASGRVLTGAKWNHRIIDALKRDGTHNSTAFRAEVLPEDGVLDVPEWAFIKTAAPNDPQAREDLKRECEIYLLRNLASNTCFRKMYDVIGSPMSMSNSDEGGIPYAAFEWLETTVADITSLPPNILLSGIETDDITAKWETWDSYFGPALASQPGHTPCAPPEVWQCQACTPASQIWALAATSLRWMKPRILGTWDCPNAPDSRAMVWIVSRLENDVRQGEFDLAKAFISEPPPVLEQISVLENEMRHMEMPTELNDWLRLTLVVNSAESPSATQVRASQEFLAFEKSLAGMKLRD